VEPNPEPIALLLDADELEALELLEDDPVDMRSEKRLELPLEAPKLEAGELLLEPDVLADEVPVAVFDEATAVVEGLTVVVLALTLEAFELEFREEPRLPLMLPRLPWSCGASNAAKRSAWIDPFSRTVRFSSPDAITAVRKVAAVGPPPFSGGTRSRFNFE
jgi:hypothetical protein